MKVSGTLPLVNSYKPTQDQWESSPLSGSVVSEILCIGTHRQTDTDPVTFIQEFKTDRQTFMDYSI